MSPPNGSNGGGNGHSPRYSVDARARIKVNDELFDRLMSALSRMDSRSIMGLIGHLERGTDESCR